MDYYKEVTDKIMHAPSVSDVWSIMPGGDKSGSILPHTSTFSGAVAASSHCFLELEPLQVTDLSTVQLHTYCTYYADNLQYLPTQLGFCMSVFVQRAFDPPPLEDSVECFRRDSQDAVDQPEILTSCALTETTQDLFSELHQTFCSLEELGSAGPSGPDTEKGSTLEGELDSGGSRRYIRSFSLQDSSLLIPRRRSVRSRQLQIPGVPLSHMINSRRNPPAQPLLSPRDIQRQVTWRGEGLAQGGGSMLQMHPRG